MLGFNIFVLTQSVLVYFFLFVSAFSSYIETMFYGNLFVNAEILFYKTFDLVLVHGLFLNCCIFSYVSWLLSVSSCLWMLFYTHTVQEIEVKYLRNSIAYCPDSNGWSSKCSSILVLLCQRPMLTCFLHH